MRRQNWVLEVMLISGSVFWAIQAHADHPKLSLVDRSPASVWNSKPDSSSRPAQVVLPLEAPKDAEPSILKQKLVNNFTPEGVAPALRRSSREGE